MKPLINYLYAILDALLQDATTYKSTPIVPFTTRREVMPLSHLCIHKNACSMASDDHQLEINFSRA